MYKQDYMIFQLRLIIPVKIIYNLKSNIDCDDFCHCIVASVASVLTWYDRETWGSDSSQVERAQFPHACTCACGH